MNLRVAADITFLWIKISTEIESCTVRRPSGIAVGFVPGGDLAGRAPKFGIDNEDLLVALAVIPAPVASPRNSVLYHRRPRELGPPGKRRERDR